MFELEYSKDASKYLKRLGRKRAERIHEKLMDIAESPFKPHPNVTQMSGMENTFRLRIGNYRAIYEVEEGKITIYVLKIAPRGQAYK